MIEEQEDQLAHIAMAVRVTHTVEATGVRGVCYSYRALPDADCYYTSGD